MHPLHWVRRTEGQTARNHFVKRYSKSVEIAACVDRTIHPPGLLRRHVGECSGDEFGNLGRLALAGQPGRNPEPGEPRIAGVVDENIRRLDILMYEAVLMDLTECFCQPDGGT